MNPAMTPDQILLATSHARSGVQAVEASLPPAAAYVIFLTLDQEIQERTTDPNHTWMQIVRHELSLARRRIASRREQSDDPLPNCLYSYVLQLQRLQ
jgi:hypothetical protein